MLSKNKIKYIRSLELKKKRKEEQVFVAMYKTQGIWEPLSAWQTGLALNISSARQGQQMCIIPKPYRQPWGHWQE